MEDVKRELVIHIHRANKYGTEHVTATPMHLDAKTGTPINIGWSDWDAPDREYTDMKLDAYVTEYGGYAGVDRPEYHDVHHMGLRRCEVMARTLKRLYAALDKAEAREAGDVFLAFAKAIGAKRVVWHKREQTATWLRDYDWRFETVSRGRDMFREWLKEAEMAHPKNAKGAEVSA